MTTHAPSAASRVAMALPIPDAAPVTRAMRVASGFAFGLGLSRLVMLRHGIDDVRHLLSGDLRFLAKAMVGSMCVFVPAAAAVLVLDLGIGWLWAAISLFMVARLVPLAWRFHGDAWVVLGRATSR